MKMTDLPQVDKLNDDDQFIIHNKTSGIRIINAEHIKRETATDLTDINEFKESVNESLTGINKDIQTLSTDMRSVNEFKESVNESLTGINRDLSELKSGGSLSSYDDYYAALDKWIPVEMRRNIYRGKNLGDSVTNEQYSEIYNRSFRDMFIGDYWRINNRTYIIADFEYFSGVSIFPHITLIPSIELGSSAIGFEKTDLGNFQYSVMYTQALKNILTGIIEPAFGSSHILEVKHNVVMSASSSGIGGYQTLTDKLLLPDFDMLFGAYHANGRTHAFYVPQTYSGQLKLFEFDKSKICIPNDGTGYWIDEYTDEDALFTINGNGLPISVYHTNSRRVRPVFSITSKG